MGYVPNHKWDIFVSYAHGDRDTVPEGWINRLKNALETAVDDGIEGKLAIFYDETGTRGNMTVSDIDHEVKASAVLVVFASPNWIRSPHCQDELKAMLAEPNGRKRVFVIEIKPPAGELRYPEHIAKLIRVEAYEKIGEVGAPIVLGLNDRLFIPRLYKIGKDIRDELMKMSAAHGGDKRQTNAFREIALAPRGTLLLASCAGVTKAQQDLTAYIAAHGHHVDQVAKMPDQSTEAFVMSLAAKLETATVFVLLLGPESCLCSATGENLTLIEIAAARSAGVKIILWRPNWLDPQGIDDIEHREVVQIAQNGPVVPELAKSIIDAIDAVQKEVASRPVGADRLIKPGRANHYVVISSAPEDSDLAGQLVEALNEPFVYAWNDYDCSPEQARKIWASCDAIAFLQANSGSATIFARMQAIHKERAAAQVAETLLGQAAIYGPPPGKLKTIGGGGMTQLDLSTDWNPARFSEWVRSILPQQSA